MKRKTVGWKVMCTALSAWLLVPDAAGTCVPMPSPVPWAREPAALTARAETGGVWRVAHAGAKDWSLYCLRNLAVAPGDVFALSLCGTIAQSGDYIGTGAELYDAKGKVIDYMHALKHLPPAGAFTNVFAVPPGVVRMTVRVTGSGPAQAVFSDFRLEKRGHIRFQPVTDRVLEDGRVKVTLRAADAAPTVTDKRTGRTWAPACKPDAKWVTCEDGATVPNGAAYRIVDTKTARELSVTYRLTPESELFVSLTGDWPLHGDRAFTYPAPFATRPGDRMIVPHNEGMGYPVDEDHENVGRFCTFGGHSLSMPFFGIAEDATGAGWMAIVETPEDAFGWARRLNGSPLWTIGPAWVGSWGEFHETRRFRYVFFDRGGHVAMCKRYRAYAKEKGLFKSFAEKAKARPNVDRLLGAANVWCWDSHPLEVVSNLHAAGIDRILWSAGGSSNDVRALAALPKTLVGRYDNYQDVPTPELVAEGIRRDMGPLKPAWPNDIAWLSPTGGLANAWSVRAKDGRWVYFARMCDRCAPAHARRVTREELAEKPFTARFIDTTVAGPWRECFHPEHPLRRADAHRWKLELLRVFGDEFGLVVGTETGHDSTVPYCDYFEGMMSIEGYRAKDCGREMQKVLDDVPPLLAKYLLGEKYRLPLWELVYHECTCAHWYWGDHVGKVPSLWRKRDLFNALYGTMGLYMFNRKMWAADREKYARSFRTTSPIARATGYAEMTDHRILKPDRSVQQTVFANGVTVTVDFASGTVTTSGLAAQEESAAGGGRGVWITHPEMAACAPRNVFARQKDKKTLAPVDTRLQNRHYLFRRTFELADVRSATLRITADDYYKLYVNGAFVAMGPAAGTTDCTYFNAVDLTPHLVRGRNVIAVHTYYQGLVNRVWVSGDNRHGLWLELDADGRRVLASDGTFKVARHTGYSEMGKAGYDTQFLERYDAGAPEVCFARKDFDDSSWIAAAVHPLGGDYRLVAQPSPGVVTERIAPIRTERLPAGGLRIDFGGIYVGGLEFAASGRKGDTVAIRCGQELNPDGSVRHKLRANCDYVEEMVLSGLPRDVLNQYDYKSFRHVELLPAPGVTIDPDSIRLVARHQPFALKAKPTFADPALEPVWKLCVDSFRYGVQEQIMDCMEREKGYYLGDGCYTMLAYCRLTEDWRQARKFFDDFLRTKSIDRGLMTCANCAFMQEIAEYPLMMLLFAHWYLAQTGDAAFIAERFDAFADVLDAYRERYARADGLLVNLDKWCVVEWPMNFRDGYDADVRDGRVCTDVHNAVNAWYVIAVRSLNAIARRLGRKPYADVAPLERAFRATFWDAERHLFVDREGSRHVSLPGNVYAAFARLAPEGDASAHESFVKLVRGKRYSSISLFQFFPLFCYLRATGEEDLLHELLVSPDAWLRNLREDGTRTFEGWGRDTKWNTSLFHLTIASAAVFMTDTTLPLP